MTRRQSEILNMYDSVLSFHGQNKEIPSPIKELMAAYTALEAVSLAIHQKAQLQETATEGYTDNKDDRKENLCFVANMVAGVVYSWAVDKKDMVTMAKVKTNKSKLRNSNSGKLADTCRIYLELAETNQAELGDYGITKQLVDELKQEIINYQSAAPQPRNAVSDRKASGSQLGLLLKEGNKAIDKIDNLTLLLKNKNPEYYARYLSNREIINTGSRSTALRLLIKDLKTGEPITGAQVIIESLQREVVSNQLGLAMLKPLPVGVYALSVQKAGYATETLAEVKATQGKTNRVEVVLKNG